MPHTVPTLIAGILLGAIGGFVVASLMPPAESAADSIDDPTSSSGKHAEDRSAALDEPDLPQESKATQVDPESAVPDSVVAHAREAVTSTAVPRSSGDGAIDGKVVDEEGNPVAGVKVKASISADRGEAAASKRGKASVERSLEEEIQSAVESYQKRKAATQETETNGDGAYRLTGLAEGLWTVAASADGFVLDAMGSSTVRTGNAVNFTAKAVVAVPVSVQLPDGRTAKKVNLEIDPDTGAGTWTELWTAEDPKLRLVPGGYQVRAFTVKSQRATNELKGETASKKERADLVAGGSAAPLTLRLEPRLGIRGMVFFGEKIELDQACVTHVQVPAGKEPDLATMGDLDRKEWIHGGSNAFEFMDLSPGRYAVALLAGWNGPVLHHRVVEVKDAVVDCDLDLRELDVAKFIAVRVLGSKGEGVANVNFTYTIKSQSNQHNGWIQPIEQAPGKYLVPPDEQISDWAKGDSSDSVLTLTAMTERLGEKSVTCPRGAREVTIKYGETGTLLVTLGGYVGSGLEGRLNVELRRSDSERRFWWNNDSNVKGDGTVTLGPSEVGDYVLELQASGEQRWNRRTIATQKVAIVAGESRATMNVPQLYSVTVRVQGNVATDGQEVSLQGSGVWENQGLKQGEAVFDRLPPGEYTFSYQSNGLSANATIKVPDQLQVTLTPRKPDAMRINIHDDKGYLAQCGFKDGDLIVGFDGVAFTDENTMQSAFSTLIGKSKVKVDVQRGTQRLAFEVDGARLMNPEEVGGNWWPTTR